MELNDIVTLILVFVFFVLPSVFKRRAKKKGAIQKKAGGKNKRPGLFGRLGDAVNTFVRDLEKQALEAKQNAQNQGQASIWERMDDRDPLTSERSEPDPFLDESQQVQPADTLEQPEIQPRDTAFEPEKIPTEPRPRALDIRVDQAVPGWIPKHLSSHELQRAVVWSEILNKPVALRDR